MESGLLYIPQKVGPEHRKLIEHYRRVREIFADPFVEPVGFAAKVPGKPSEEPPKEPEKPVQKPDNLAPWEKIAYAASSVLSSGEVTIEDVLTRGVDPAVVLVRSVLMYMMHEELELDGAPMSFTAIVKRLNRRNHTTALYAWRKINAQLKTDEDLRKSVESIRILYASR